MRRVVGGPGGVEVVLLEQVGLPLPPLDRLQPVSLEAQDGVATGLSGVTEQEAAHVHPVDLAVGRHGPAPGEDQGGEQVDLVHELVADLARRHLARPADDAIRPERALQRSEQRTPPRAPEPAPQPAERVRVTGGEPVGRIGAVVGGPYHDRVVGQPQRVQLVEIWPVKSSIWVSMSAQLPCLVLPAYSGSGMVGMCTWV
jgi:hypothetical protein